MEREEVFARIKEASFPEQLIAVAKEAGKELDPAQAKEMFEELKKVKAENLLLEDLDHIAGGGFIYRTKDFKGWF